MPGSLSGPAFVLAKDPGSVSGTDIKREDGQDGQGQPQTAPAETPASGSPEPPGSDPGDISGHESPHHALSSPTENADPTEWPTPTSTVRIPWPRPTHRAPTRPDPKPSAPASPYPDQDIEADPVRAPERDRQDR